MTCSARPAQKHEAKTGHSRYAAPQQSNGLDSPIARAALWMRCISFFCFPPPNLGAALPSAVS
ncbi:hypothetical protein BMF35_a0873 [Aurantiacibacter gangjinensis]|nr:hypothetical protein BMF35_a0873 [Aurantiacibacter gangjinensis]